MSELGLYTTGTFTPAERNREHAKPTQSREVITDHAHAANEPASRTDDPGPLVQHRYSPSMARAVGTITETAPYRPANRW